MIQPLDGPAIQFILSSVGTTTPVKAQEGVNPFPERQVVTLQGDGKFYVYFANASETPTNTDISTKGFTQSKDAIRSYEAGDQQILYVLAEAGTVNIRGAERA